jgi:hypothetical protein
MSAAYVANSRVDATEFVAIVQRVHAVLTEALVAVHTKSVRLGAAANTEVKLRALKQLAAEVSTLQLHTRELLRVVQKVASENRVEAVKAGGATKGTPPKAFAFVLACTAKPGRAEEVLGDVETEFHKMVACLGAVRAAWWYRVYVAKLIIRVLPGIALRILVLHKLGM